MITLGAQTVMNGLSAGFSLGLVAVGLSLVWRISRFLHAAHAATYLLGGYVGLSFVRAYPEGFGVAALLSGLAGMTLGAGIDVAVYRQLRRRNASSAAMLLGSLAVLIVVQNAVALMWGSDILAARSDELQSITMMGASVTVFRVWAWGAVLLITFVLWTFVYRSKTGLIWRGVASDPTLAKIHGVNTESIHLAVMGLVSGLAGLAGFLNAFETALTPTIGFGVLLTAVTGVIVGGIGSVYGALLGVLLVGIVRQGTGLFFAGGWDEAPVFAILFIFLVFRPYGIMGKRPFKVTV